MTAIKTAPNPTLASAPRPPLRRALSKLSGAALLFVAVAAGGYAVWQSVRDRVLAAPHYQLTAEQVTITPPPGWIHSDVKGEALREAALDGPLSVVDDGLTQRIHEAFTMHPWVANVERVAKFSPARVEVELVYRRPVCMVQVGDGLFPVDIEGVLLPTGDFSPLEAGRYPRLAGVRLAAEPVAGLRWHDERVEQAARIAALLAETWDEMKLHHIEPLAVSAGKARPAAPEFALLTRSGARILWGTSPSDDPVAQKAASDKLARLKSYFLERGSLDEADGEPLDLRHASTPRPTSRGAEASAAP